MSSKATALSFLRNESTIDAAIEKYARDKSLTKQAALIPFATEILSSQEQLADGDFSKLIELDEKVMPQSEDTFTKITKLGINLLFGKNTPELNMDPLVQYRTLQYLSLFDPSMRKKHENITLCMTLALLDEDSHLEVLGALKQYPPEIQPDIVGELLNELEDTEGSFDTQQKVALIRKIGNRIERAPKEGEQKKLKSTPADPQQPQGKIKDPQIKVDAETIINLLPENDRHPFIREKLETTLEKLSASERGLLIKTVTETSSNTRLDTLINSIMFEKSESKDIRLAATKIMKLLRKTDLSIYLVNQLTSALLALNEDGREIFTKIIEETPIDKRAQLVKGIVFIKETPVQQYIITTLSYIPAKTRTEDVVANVTALIARAVETGMMKKISDYIRDLEDDELDNILKLATPVLLNRRLPDLSLAWRDETYKPPQRDNSDLGGITDSRACLLSAAPMLHKNNLTPQVVDKLDFIFGTLDYNAAKTLLKKIGTQDPAEQLKIIDQEHQKASG